jgi:hypothetical protein
VEAPKDSTLHARVLNGEFVVRMVASTGSRRGETTEGTLRLMPQDSAYRSLELPDGSSSSTVTLPLYGTAAIDFAAVGAVIPGDAASEDPQSPGVLAIENPDRLLLRVGSEANRRGMRRFDGAYTVLQVQQITEEGFAGTWRSGVNMEQSGGHYCAKRSTG